MNILTRGEGWTAEVKMSAGNVAARAFITWRRANERQKSALFPPDVPRDSRTPRHGADYHLPVAVDRDDNNY